MVIGKGQFALAAWIADQRRLPGRAPGRLGVCKRLCGPDVAKSIEQAVHRRAKAGKGFKTTVRALRAKITALDKKITKGTENLLLANSEDMEDLSRLLSEWRADRARLHCQLVAVAPNPNGDAPSEKAKRAIVELKRLRHHLQTGDPMKVRAVVKAMVAEIPIWWERHGRQRRVAENLIMEQNARGVMQHTSSGASHRPAVFTWRDLTAERRFERAAKVLSELYEGQPMPARIVGDRLGIRPSSAAHLLARAQSDGLVVAVTAKGWLPSFDGGQRVQ